MQSAYAKYKAQSKAAKAEAWGDEDFCAWDLKTTIHEVRPRHARKFGHFTRAWFRANQKAFIRAFAASGESWPSSIGAGNVA